MQQLSNSATRKALSKAKGDDWTFKNHSTRDHTHSYHDYPARMIPQIADKLLDLFGKKNGIMFDPYCGSGTSLVEGIKHQMNTVGFDLNPLARLIAKAKTQSLDLKELEKNIQSLKAKFTKQPEGVEVPADFTIAGITDVNFWFKKPVIQKLQLIKNHIDLMKNVAVADFLKVAFSETVRETSNTRNDEFKLYRYAEEKLAKHNPDVYAIMLKKISRNVQAYEEMHSHMSVKSWHDSEVYNLNSCLPIPESVIMEKSVDVVVTSPPYGDSRTTVAYGQYSRLSSAWLDFENPEKVDKNLMGGTKKRIEKLPSKKINQSIAQIAEIDLARAEEVYSFYKDLNDSIQNVAKVLKKGGHVCYVVGNRRVKEVTLPTDIVIKDFFENVGLTYVTTFIREIPNKRMPLKNSPTNKTGKTATTMLNEYIVVLKK